MRRPIVSAGHVDRHPRNDWRPVHYGARFDEHWVTAGGARQCLFYCPWGGEKLPLSKRGRGFDEPEALGLDPSPIRSRKPVAKKGTRTFRRKARVPIPCPEGVAIERSRPEP